MNGPQAIATRHVLRRSAGTQKSILRQGLCACATILFHRSSRISRAPAAKIL
jgi:hypothetical protein